MGIHIVLICEMGIIIRTARDEDVCAKHPAHAWHVGLNISSAVFTVALKALGTGKRWGHPTVVTELCLAAERRVRAAAKGRRKGWGQWRCSHLQGFRLFLWRGEGLA